MEIPGSSALLTDLYELTMAAVYFEEGMADRSATFSLFVRELPPNRGYLVVAGLDDALAWLEGFRLGGDELAFLAGLGMFSSAFLEYLGDLRFTGSVRAVPEGTIAFAEEPLLEVDAPIAMAQIAETMMLNQLTTQTTLATKAARLQHAARGRAVLDFALRRTQGVDAGMKLARVGRIAGLAGTSNVAGSATYGAVASGTMAHAFVQAYENEIDAFRAFASRFGDQTVLLVDTYDTIDGVAKAITVAHEMQEQGHKLRGIRLDSGDLADLAHRSRAMLDDAGLPDVQIYASGGLDEEAIDDLLGDEDAPIDGFGVGSSLAVSKDAPVLDSVYKLVEFDGRAVRKTSEGKVTWPGRKQVWRIPTGVHDILATAAEEGPAAGDSLLVEVMQTGERTDAGRGTLDRATERFTSQWSAIPDEVKSLRDPSTYPVEVSETLSALAERVDRARHDNGDNYA